MALENVKYLMGTKETYQDTTIMNKNCKKDYLKFSDSLRVFETGYPEEKVEQIITTHDEEKEILKNKTEKQAETIRRLADIIKDLKASGKITDEDVPPKMYPWKTKGKGLGLLDKMLRGEELTEKEWGLLDYSLTIMEKMIDKKQKKDKSSTK
jgi:hypothetical protein